MMQTAVFASAETRVVDEPTIDNLPLGQAIVEWADPAIIESMRKVERGYTKGQLIGWEWPRLVPDSALRPASNSEWMAGGGDPTYVLKDAWRKVELQLKRKLREEKFSLSGVMVRPELTTVPTSIPGVWASELNFDLVNDVVVFGKHRYTAVRLSESAPNQPVAGEVSIAPDPLSGRLPQITPENVRDLSDDEVCLLLEDHARRVVEGPDTKMIAPGTVLVMPIIRRKMRFRAKEKVLATTLAEEARVLADWIASKLPSHQTPVEGSIKNSVRTEYASLKAQSNSIVP